MRAHRLFAASAVLLAALAAGAEAPLPSWLAVEQRPGRDTTVPDALLQIAPERLAEIGEDDHAYVDLARRAEITLYADGRLVERKTQVRRLLNDTGVRDHGNLSQHVRSQVARVAIEEAWVEHADGRINDFDPTALQIVSDPDPDVFSDVQVLVFPFSGLDAGATLVLVTREETDLTRWPLHWSRMYFPRVLEPTESFEVIVGWQPDETPAPRYATDDPDLSCETGPGRIHCTRRRIPPVPFDPHVDWYDRLPHLAVGAAGSWAELAEREREVVLGAAAADMGLDALAAELGLDRGSPRERLERIHRFVADRIRYVGLEHGARAVVPHDAGETLARRYGDCKDKVALFLALADRAGVPAHPVLVGTERFAVDKLILPSWRYFDHMIACSSLDDEAPLCVDLTDPHSATGQLPVALGGAVALPLVEGVRTPTVLSGGSHAWRIEVEAENELDCDGAIDERLTRRFVGAGAASMRAEIGALNASDRLRWLEESYTEVMGELEPQVDVQGLRDPESDLTLTTRTRFVARSPAIEHTHWNEHDAWLVHYAQLFRTANQHHPYRMQGLSVSIRSVYRLCSQVRATFLGANLDLVSDIGSLRRRYEASGNSSSVTVSTDLAIPRRVYGPGELERFNRFLDRTLGQTRIWFGIAPEGASR